jgi:3-oxoacyl-[acyl-carrier protein] reductase
MPDVPAPSAAGHGTPAATGAGLTGAGHRTEPADSAPTAAGPAPGHPPTEPYGGEAAGRRLDGRAALVTGGARGIGAAIATALADEGADVAIVDVLGDQAAERAAGLPGEASAVAADLRRPDQVEEAVATVAERYGRLDVVVNNAGVFRSTPLLDIGVDEWDLMFEVNVRSILLTTQAAAPYLAKSPAARIVNLASMGGKLGEPGQAHYAASKAAVIALTRVAAMELGPLGVTVNCICPSYVATEMGATTRTPEQIAEWSALSPLGRIGTPDDVARMAVFLASDDAAYCTGQAFNVTGGMVMH